MSEFPPAFVIKFYYSHLSLFKTTAEWARDKSCERRASACDSARSVGAYEETVEFALLFRKSHSDAYKFREYITYPI